MMQLREKIISTVKKSWSSALGCNILDLESGITFIKDSFNPRLSDVKIKEEIYILNYREGGTIIAVSDECFGELSEIVKNFGFDNLKMGQLLQKTYKGILVFHYYTTSYLFTDKHLKSIDNNIRELGKSENILYDEFMSKCSDKDKKEVYMDFDDPFHTFYAYFDNNKNIVSVGNYCRDDEEDQIAHIGILTREEFKGKGYGKSLVNTITHKILEKGLVPQYRVSPDNIPSKNIAKNLGYEELLQGYSLIIKHS